MNKDVRDDNLRLVLSAGEAKYIEGERKVSWTLICLCLGLIVISFSYIVLYDLYLHEEQEMVTVDCEDGCAEEVSSDTENSSYRFLWLSLVILSFFIIILSVMGLLSSIYRLFWISRQVKNQTDFLKKYNRE